MLLSFVKMQGIGNDFIVLDHRSERTKNLREKITLPLAVQLCDRRFGIGADQILWLKPAENREAEVRMEILNADGSIAEMCGNGIRAVALFVHQNSLQGLANPSFQKNEYLIETLAGLKKVQVEGESVRVDMGPPVLGEGFKAQGEELEVFGKKLKFFEVNMGNPHAVFFVDEVHQLPYDFSIEKLGSEIENHPRFPKRTNVEFVQVKNSSSIVVRVWERGAGVTLACGTGACASAVAALATSRVHGPVEVNLPGGKLIIDWKGMGQSVFMKGPAKEVFTGTIHI